MNLGNNIFRRLLTIAFLILVAQSAAYAQPLFIPGFLGIENSYIETPQAGSESANVYFTLTNLHHEPILILSASGEIFDNATLKGSNNENLEFIEVLPRERLILESGGMHIQLNDIDDSIATGDTYELTLLVRRGREAMEYVEEFFDSSIREFMGGGIPNEKEYILHVPVRN